MVLLVVKNDISIDNLLNCLKGVPHIVVESHQSIIIPENCSGIILAGSNMHVYNESDLNKTFGNIQSLVQGAVLQKCPILGICYGMQIIAKVFGGEVTPLKYPLRGEIEVNLDPKSLIFTGKLYKTVAMFNNTDIVSKVPKGFRITGWLSGQRKAIAIQNKDKHIFGVQFHPENLKTTRIIIDKFLDLCQSDTRPVQVQPTQVQPTQVQPTQVQPTQVQPTQVQPTQVQPTQVQPTQVQQKMDFRDIIINKLKDYVLQEKVNKQYFKAKAYTTVINELSKSNQPIYSFEDIAKVKGIGKSITEKIKFIFEKPEDALKKTGEMEAVENLTKVFGIGNAKAIELFSEYGIKTVEDLKKHSELLNNNQKIGLIYFDDIEKRIPYKEMEKHKIYLTSLMKPNVVWDLAGSFRRHKSDSGDIDVIVNSGTTSSLEEFINQLKESGYVKEVLALGDKKFMGICKLPRHKTHRRIDILFTEPEKYPFAILYFTGSKDFNVNMRNIALSKGYSLNEYGLTNVKTKKKVNNIKTEKEIFDFLDIQWVEPKDR
jgi:DNA polymerase beta